MTADKPVHEQVKDLLNRWNKPTNVQDYVDRHIGTQPEPGDTRATVAVQDPVLDHDRNPARDDIDAQRAFQDDGDDEPEGDEAPDYDSMTNAALKEILEARGLAKSGNHDELVARLEEDDAADDAEDDEDE